MSYTALFILFMIIPSQTIYVPEDCEARSEWKFDYAWTNMHISVWVPLEEDSRILTLEIELAGFNFPITYDNIEIFKGEVQYARFRNSKPHQENTVFSSLISDGWADFEFTLDSHYGLKYYMNDSVLLLNSSLDYRAKSLRVKGSNITVNCPSKLKMWNIIESVVAIPLDNSTKHFLSFFSTEEFLPSIAIEKREFNLGYDNGYPTTLPIKAKPLPPFKEHHLEISCSKDNKSTCRILIGENREEAEEFLVSDLQRLLSVRKIRGGPFFAFLHNGDPIPSVTQLPVVTQLYVSPEEPKWMTPTIFILMWIIIGMFIIDVILLCAIFFIQYKIHSYKTNKDMKGSTLTFLYRLMKNDARMHVTIIRIVMSFLLAAIESLDLIFIRRILKLEDSNTIDMELIGPGEVVVLYFFPPLVAMMMFGLDIRALRSQWHIYCNNKTEDPTSIQEGQTSVLLNKADNNQGLSKRELSLQRNDSQVSSCSQESETYSSIMSSTSGSTLDSTKTLIQK